MTTATRRSLALGAFATTALTALAANLPPGVARAQGGGFSVSGKRGPYVKQISHQQAVFQAASAPSTAGDAINLGRYQAARLRMPQTEAAVARLLGQIDGQWPYQKGPPLQVQILGLPYYNAYSLPDGSIVVALGLLDNAKSDDEVAFVLAHELGHVRLGHFQHQPAADIDARRAQMASSMGLLFSVAQQVPVGGAAGSAISAATEAGASNDLIHFMSNVMIEPSHTRDQEDQADCIGYDLSQSGGFAPDAASARVFDTIVADQTQRTQQVDNLNGQMHQQVSQAVGPSTASSLLSGDTTSILSTAGRFMLSAAANGSGNHSAPPQHRPPEERKKGIAQYSTDAYPEGAPLRDEQHSWLDGVRRTGEFVQGKAAVTAVNEAKLARADGRYGVAMAAIARARHTAFGSAPLVLNEAARLAADQGDHAAADRLFAQADASPDQTVDGYVDYVRMLFQRGENDRAMQVAQEGVQRFNNDQKPFIALMIGVARAQGRDDEVQGYLRTCQGYRNDGLARDCRLAAGQSADAPQQQQQAPHIPSSLPFSIPHF
jgi:hypothetical protein